MTTEKQTPEELAPMPQLEATSKEPPTDLQPCPDIKGFVSGGGLDHVMEKAREMRNDAPLLRLLTDIRFAVGDDGLRMQDELVEYLRQMRADAEAYRAGGGRDD